jgi:tetratricopeptide (TPR) repeat protein
MLSALLGDEKDLIPLKHLIIERTQGTPFFMEEMVQALFEEGVLQRNGTLKPAQPISAIKVPPTVQAVLASRIDRLVPAHKELLQTLAVLGPEFSLNLVQRVSPRSSDELEQMLSHLQLSEFINEKPSVGDIEYSFKHVLTQEVAYKSVLVERRKLLHERTAQAIEALFHQRLDDHYADLAHHYRSSHNASKAIEYLCLAGEQAARRGAYAQSVANVDPALALIEQLPEGPERLRAELGVRLMQGMCVPALYGIGSEQRRQTFQRVCDLSEQLQDRSALIPGLLNVAGAHLSGGEISSAVEISKRCVELAERSGDPKMLSAALLQLAACTRLAGDLVRVSLICDQLMARIGSAHQGGAAELLPINLWVDTLNTFALTQQILGRPDEALKLSYEAVRSARQLGHPFSLALAFVIAAGLWCYRDEVAPALTIIEALIALAKEHGFREMLALGQSIHGWAITRLGQIDLGVAESEANSALLPAQLQIMAAPWLAQVQIDAGRPERALEVLDGALAGSERTGRHHDHSDLLRLKGEAILKLDVAATAEAEACYRRAIEIARGQSAKWWELLATVSLARLLRDSGRRDEARAMLAEIYNWFTEGFDTPDLKEAKALLDELSR